MWRWRVVVAVVSRGSGGGLRGGRGANMVESEEVEIEGAEARGGGGWIAFPRLAHVR